MAVMRIEPRWEADAREHSFTMNELLYPHEDVSKSALRERQHQVSSHPIYNFVHTYYRFSAAELKRYSPGVDVELSLVSQANRDLLHSKYLLPVSDDSSDFKFVPPHPLKADGRHGWIALSRTRDILLKTMSRPPQFACFGLHEWAMLYSNRSVASLDSRHQPQLDLRVSQEVIDDAVETLTLRCSHFDAWRFFHPAVRFFHQTVLSHPLQPTVLHEHNMNIF